MSRWQVAVTALVVALWEFKAVFYAVWSPFVWLVGYNDPRKPSDDLLHGVPPPRDTAACPPARPSPVP